LVNGDFSSFTGALPDNWSAYGYITAAQDVSNFETKTYGVKLTSGVGASGAITQAVETNNPKTPLGFLKNKWVTVAVRVRKPVGQLVTAGRIEIYDGTNTIFSPAAYAGNGEFYWDVLSLKVSNSATTLRIYIFADTSSTGSIDVTIDRAILCVGVLPKDIF
jgi:hypothetical protein